MNLQKFIDKFGKKQRSNTVPYSSVDFFIPEKKFTFAEPQTIASYILENTPNDSLHKKHKLHKAKLSNEWVNPSQAINSGLGTANLSFFNYQYINYQECGLLAQDPLMNNIFDILTITPLSMGGSIKIFDEKGEDLKDDNLQDLIENKLYKKYRVRETLEQAIKSTYIYGGCMLYIDYGDENYLESPLELDKIDKRRLRGFRLIDPIYCSPVEVNSYEVARKDYMKPNKWYVVGLGVVHTSRFIKFEWNTPPLSLKPLCNYFGMPYTLLLKQDVANANLVSQGLANLVNKIRRTYLKMDKQVFASGNLPAVMNRLRSMQEIENNFTIFPIDYTEDIVQLTTSLNGIQDTIETFFDILSSKTGIPRNKLKGSSTGGLNAHTSQVESDKNFSDKVQAIQENLIKDRLVKMLTIVAGTIDNKVYNLDYEFRPLYTMSLKDTTETINGNLDIALKMRQLGIRAEDCINWLRSNEINNMETAELDKTTELMEADYADKE